MSKISSIRDRITDYLKVKGISKYKFYQKTQLSNGFLDKGGSMTTDNCEKICYEFPDLNPEWLLTGKGGMIKLILDGNDTNVEVNESIQTLTQRIIDLSNENAKLKQKFREINRVVIHKTADEDKYFDNLAAEPKP